MKYHIHPKIGLGWTKHESGRGKENIADQETTNEKA